MPFVSLTITLFGPWSVDRVSDDMAWAMWFGPLKLLIIWPIR